jgi:hypothetical protein
MPAGRLAHADFVAVGTGASLTIACIAVLAVLFRDRVVHSLEQGTLDKEE